MRLTRSAYPSSVLQWHPEIPDDATGERLFGWLVGAARRSTGSPSGKSRGCRKEG